MRFDRTTRLRSSTHLASRCVAAVGAGLLAAACADEAPTAARGPSRGPNASIAAASRLGPRTGRPIDVPAVQMDLPDQPRAWDTSDSALTAAIAAEDGHAVIGFKEVGNSNTFGAGGRRGAVTAGAIRGALNMLEGRGVSVVEYYDAIGAAHVRMPAELAGVLRAHPLVDYIEPRQYGQVEAVAGTFRGTALRSAAVTLTSGQTVPWGINLIRAPQAWQVTRGAGASIQIIDTGHPQGHEDLPFVPSSNCAGAYGGCDDAYPSPHGSHVMGIALARDNGLGVIGVAPDLAGAQTYSYGACDNNGSCPTTQVTAGINAAIFNTRVISLSLRNPYDAAQANAVAQAWANNIVIVAAAGNNGGRSEVYPAKYTNVLGVSGVNQYKGFASTSPCPKQGGGYASSNYGPHVDLAAPFWALSTVPGGYADETSGWCGTSMATPHVSGTAALVLAYNPSWSNQQVVNQLIATAEDLGGAGKDEYYGHGLVDAGTALGIPRPPKLVVGITGSSSVSRNTVALWHTAISGGTPPYTYSWYKDNAYVGANYTPYSYYISGSTPLGTEIVMQLQVQDATGQVGSALFVSRVNN